MEALRIVVDGEPTDYYGNAGKYLSLNPFVRLVVGKFLKDVDELVKLTGARRILDLGCGEGFVSKHLKECNEGVNIKGLDVSLRALKEAKGLRAMDELVRADAYRAPFKDGAFDLVLCCELLEHLHEPDKVVLEIKRLSRSWALITVPLEPWFRVANILRLKHLRRIGNTPGHIQKWTKKAFESFLKKHFNETLIKTSTVWILALCRNPST